MENHYRIFPYEKGMILISDDPKIIEEFDSAPGWAEITSEKNFKVYASLNVIGQILKKGIPLEVRDYH